MTDRLLRRLGEHYLLLMMLVTRLFALIGGGLTVYYIHLTLALTSDIVHHLIVGGLTVVVAAVAATILIAQWETRDVRRVIRQLRSGAAVAPSLAVKAGRRAVLFPGQHVYVEAVVDPFLTVLPLCLYLWFVGDVSWNTLGQVVVAGFLGISSVLIATYFVCETWMVAVIRYFLEKNIRVPFESLPIRRLNVRMYLSISLIIVVTAVMIGSLANQRAEEIIQHPSRQIEAVASLRKHTLYILLFATSVGVLLARMLSNSVASRIDLLMNAMKQVQEGGLSKRVVMGGNDEIDVLGRQFNTMVEELEQNHHTIRDLNVNLELKVQKRTNELESARADAEAANKAKSDFIANISHELRTPLNGVIGMTELLLNTTLNSQQQRYAKMARFSGTTLLELLNEVLDFSKIEAGKLELENIEFKLLDVIEPVVEVAAHRCQEKGIELACYVDPNIPLQMQGDPGRLRQILTNLTNNAIKFTEKGSVTVRANMVHETDIHVYVRFSVRDTGIGIPKSRFGRLFKSFSQVDASTTRQYGGTGLGLAICKELCELMDGDIGFESEPGRGSIFSFRIPLEKTRTPEVQRFQVPRSLNGLRVLVVGREGTGRNLIVKQLCAWQFDVDTASSHNSVLDCVSEAAAERRPYEVVLYDMDLVGRESLSWVTAVHSEKGLAEPVFLQFVPLSAQIDEAAVRHQGFAGYISQPVLPSELFSVIDSSVSRHRHDDANSVSGRFRSALRDSSQSRTLSRTSRPNARILLAEDNAINQEVAVEILKNAGFKCDIANNGREAFEIVQRDRYDLVLMDCQMPEMDGLEATRAIRRYENEREDGKTGPVPIVALTASALTGERERCLAAGMTDYLTKPLDPIGLIETIESHLSELEANFSGDDSTNEDEEMPRGTCHEIHAGEELHADDIRETFDFDELLRRCMGKRDVAARLIDRFRCRLESDLQQLEESIMQRDAGQTATLAHALKGAAANLSAKALRREAARLEQLARADEWDGLDECFEKLSERCEQFLSMEIVELEFANVCGAAAPIETA